VLGTGVSIKSIFDGREAGVRQQWLATALAAGFVALAGCTAPGGAPDSPGPSVADPPSASPQQAPEQAAVEAYEGMWRAFSTASESADWQSPELARYASGYALEQLVENLQANEVRGIETRGTFEVNPTVVSAEPPEAPTVVRILDCGDDSGTTRVRSDDGTPIEGGSGGRHRIEAQVRLVDAVWIVEDFRLREAGSC
jgi:hypothetical protein